MKQAYIICICLLTFGLSTFNSSAQCNNGRYRDKIFGVSTNVQQQYGSAPKYDGSNQDLYMDIFQPSGDNFARRPLIILAFGGSFTSGVRQSPDILQLCNDFAKRGFVTATIDYRIGKENGDDTSMYKAVLRGIQDMNGAIRYFYKDVYTNNHYRIDTNQIYIGGTSAGAFIGLNKAYQNLNVYSRPVPQDFLLAFGAVGGPDGTNNPGYNSNVKGVIDLCGAVFDTIWMQPGGPILVGVHGTADNTVSFYYDSALGAQDIKKRFFGGGDIINRMNHLGSSFTGYIYPFYGADHAPFVLPIPLVPPASLYMDTTIQVLQDFLYAHTDCDSTRIGQTGILDPDYHISVSALPNPADDILTVYSHEAEALQVEVYSIDGKLMQSFDLAANGRHYIRKGELSAGMYILQYYDHTGTVKLRSDKIVFE
ncbi:MAG: T9SS type A sorting domain-containing protein [Bacteroidetes bacterium]|nr:T9SS type A sorting domain-containing protein [Bacteroidota bacterium]